MNIFKTFEIFLREPLSILKERFIQIVNIQSNMFSSPVMTAEMLDRKTQITIVNGEKMYNLCQTVLYKQRMKDELKKDLQSFDGNIQEQIQWARPQSNNQTSSKQVVLGQLLKRE